MVDKYYKIEKDIRVLLFKDIKLKLHTDSKGT
jgi:hypothetical protein